MCIIMYTRRTGGTRGAGVARSDALLQQLQGLLEVVLQLGEAVGGLPSLVLGHRVRVLLLRQLSVRSPDGGDQHLRVLPRDAGRRKPEAAQQLHQTRPPGCRRHSGGPGAWRAKGQGPQGGRRVAGKPRVEPQAARYVMYNY